MTPAEFAAVQADMAVGTPGDFIHLFGETIVYTKSPHDGCRVFSLLRAMGATQVDMARFARVPKYEAAIIADAEVKAAQAAEIDRLRAALADIIPTNRLHGVTPNSAGKQIWFDGPSASIARAALEGTPK